MAVVVPSLTFDPVTITGGNIQVPHKEPRAQGKK
jgi:hypothetical protein